MDLINQIFPTLRNNNIQYLKKEEYESYYSKPHKYPLLVIERLGMNTGFPDKGYEKVKRTEVDDPFMPDPTINSEYSFSFKDYGLMMSYGLSPGHNAPAGHHHSKPSNWESTFLYSNICPQEMVFNSGIWVLIENWCKFISKQQKFKEFTNLRIFTGSIPDKKETVLRFGDNNISVNIPTHMFKLVVARSKKPEHNNTLFMGCFLCPNRPIDPLKKENQEIHRWLIPLPVLEKMTKMNFNPLLHKYYSYKKNTFKIQNINDIVEVKFSLNHVFQMQMLKSQWYGIIIYSSNLEELEKNWVLIQKDKRLEGQDLKYHEDFYLLVKDRFNANMLANNSNYLNNVEITKSSSNNNSNSNKGVMKLQEGVIELKDLDEEYNNNWNNKISNINSQQSTSNFTPSNPISSMNSQSTSNSITSNSTLTPTPTPTPTLSNELKGGLQKKITGNKKKKRKSLKRKKKILKK